MNWVFVILIKDLFFLLWVCFILIWFQLIEALISGKDLTESESEDSLDFLLDGADEALISAFLVLLRAKGETFEEVSSFLQLFTLFRLTYFRCF